MVVNVRNSTGCREGKKARKSRRQHAPAPNLIPEVTYTVVFNGEKFVINGKGSVDSCELIHNRQFILLCRKIGLPQSAWPTHIRAIDGHELLEQLQIIKKYAI